ncbi:MAG TPA: asparagine synthase C-terminal domain-containing protein [Arenibaculum sp.]|nr:asparagine synthase C-terminal domain-containing protein [Arenibaculum sp.]
MSGICGWISRTAPPRAPCEIMAAMLASLPASGMSDTGTGPTAAASAPGTAAGTAAGTLGARGAAHGAWHSCPDLACIIVGEPRWADAGLAALARDAGDGAALARGWTKLGIRVVQALAGDFALAVIDHRAEEAFVAIDRAGRHAIAFQALPDGLVFGTSIDSVLAHPQAAGTLSEQALFDFFHLSMIPAPATVYRDVAKLQPAQFVHWRRGTVRTDFYWTMAYGDAPDDLATLGRELMERLDRAVADAMGGVDETLGVFLSGGLDSSTVAGLAARRRGAKVSCFTIGFDDDEFDERRYAGIAARHFGTPHIQYTVSAADTARVLEKVATAYDEPFGNSSCIPTYFCARLAREHGVKVMLAGDGGDELFAGNARYALQLRFDQYRRVPAVLRSMLEPALMRLPLAGGPTPLRRIQGYVRRAREPMPNRMETYSYLHSGSRARVFAPDFLDAVDPDGPIEVMRAVYRRGTDPSLLRLMLHYDLQVTLADNDLRKVGRMCDLAGVGVRFPFLDDRVVAFSGTVPPELLIRRGRLRHFYKEVMKDFLPAEIIAKEKHGFGLPFRIWMRRPGPLRDLVGDVLGSFKKRRLVRGDFIDDLLGGWDAEEAKLYGQLAWYMVALELWLGRPGPAKDPPANGHMREGIRRVHGEPRGPRVVARP